MNEKKKESNFYGWWKIDWQQSLINMSQWMKLVNGTQIFLFNKNEWDFVTSYYSGPSYL